MSKASPKTRIHFGVASVTGMCLSDVRTVAQNSSEIFKHILGLLKTIGGCQI